MGQRASFTEEMKIEARQMFIEGYEQDGKRTYPTLMDLVHHFKVSKATLYRRAKDEQWQKQKNQFQSQVFESREEERKKQLIKEGEKLDTNSLQIAHAMLARVGKKLHRAMQAEQNDSSVDVLSSSELRELSHVAANAQKIGKLALGEAQEISKVSADVNAPESFRTVMERLDEVAAEFSSHDSITLQ